jgi:hypothetical protein
MGIHTIKNDPRNIYIKKLCGLIWYGDAAVPDDNVAVFVDEIA